VEGKDENMILKVKHLNIRQIADSGQCFRMNPTEDGGYHLVAYRKYLTLRQPEEDILELECSPEDYEAVWRDYFHMDYDYGSIVDRLERGSDDFLRNAVRYGRGIRILKQEPFEMLISFIISQNKNIPSIKTCIERICEKYGDRLTDQATGAVYYAFPSPERLAEAKKEDLRQLKLGYRDSYILNAAGAVAEGRIKLEELKTVSHEEAVKTLCTIHGVGTKVANCVSLYGLQHIEAFPVDVWIRRILSEVYSDSFDTTPYRGYAGILQQYMFYYIRSLKEGGKAGRIQKEALQSS
jgi:N-glycosylase/DNA lyase